MNDRTYAAIEDIRSEVGGISAEAKQYANMIVVGSESNFKQTVDQFKASVTTTYATKEELATTNDLLNAQTTKIERYMTFGTDYLVIGNSASKFNVQITNDAINFRNGNAVLAYMSNQKLYIKDAEITQSLQIGDYV